MTAGGRPLRRQVSDLELLHGAAVDCVSPSQPQQRWSQMQCCNTSCQTAPLGLGSLWPYSNLPHHVGMGVRHLVQVRFWGVARHAMSAILRFRDVYGGFSSVFCTYWDNARQLISAMVRLWRSGAKSTFSEVAFLGSPC